MWTLIRPKGAYDSEHRVMRTQTGVLINGDRIEAVGPESKVLAHVPSGATVTTICLPEHFLLPGLINTHVHLSFTAGSNPRADYERDAPAVRVARALKHSQELLQSGVTTARDCGSDWLVLQVLQVASLRLFALPRLIMCGPPITISGGHLHQMGGEADGVEAIRALVRRLKKAGANSIKIMATGGQMTPNTIPESAAFTMEELQVAHDTAVELGLPTVAHVLGTEGMRRAALVGFDSLEHCAFFHREEHGWLERRYDEETTKLIAKSGKSVMMGLAAGYNTHNSAREGGAKTPQESFLLQQEERMMEIFMRFVDHGIAMVCGTDAGVRDTPFSETYRELELMIQAGLLPAEAIHAATLGAARALHMDNQIGAIRGGYMADLIATPTNPLEEPSAFRTVDWVMASGEVVRDRQHA